MRGRVWLLLLLSILAFPAISQEENGEDEVELGLEVFYTTIPLGTGGSTTTIEVTVTSLDGTTSTDYTIDVYRDFPSKCGACNLLQGECTSSRECVCLEGFTGDDCGDCCNPGCDHGTCDNTVCSCECDKGWTGETCQESTVFGGNNFDENELFIGDNFGTLEMRGPYAEFGFEAIGIEKFTWYAAPKDKYLTGSHDEVSVAVFVTDFNVPCQFNGGGVYVYSAPKDSYLDQSTYTNLHDANRPYCGNDKPVVVEAPQGSFIVFELTGSYGEQVFSAEYGIRPILTQVLPDNGFEGELVNVTGSFFSKWDTGCILDGEPTDVIRDQFQQEVDGDPLVQKIVCVVPPSRTFGQKSFSVRNTFPWLPSSNTVDFRFNGRCSGEVTLTTPSSRITDGDIIPGQIESDCSWVIDPVGDEISPISIYGSPDLGEGTCDDASITVYTGDYAVPSNVLHRWCATPSSQRRSLQSDDADVGSDELGDITDFDFGQTSSLKAVSVGPLIVVYKSRRQHPTFILSYQTTPVVTSVFPLSSGTYNQGIVTVSGFNFAESTVCHWGDSLGETVSVSEDGTSVLCRAPLHRSGAVTFGASNDHEIAGEFGIDKGVIGFYEQSHFWFQGCQPGLYSSNYTMWCVLCSTGTFSTVEGSTTCELCPKGKFSGAGSTACTDCSPGLFSSREGVSLCDPCPYGSWSSHSSTVCTLCGGNNTAQNEGQTTQETGSSSMDACTCKPGYYSLRNSTATVANSTVVVETSSSEELSCYTCTTSAFCPGAESPPYPKSGFYAIVEGNPESFRLCAAEEACLEISSDLRANMTEADDVCGEGYRGFMCGQCQEGYYSVHTQCYQCEPIHTVLTWLMGAGLILLFLLLPFVMNFIIRQAGKAAGSSTLAFTVSLVSEFVYFVQVLATFRLFRLRWPQITLDLFANLNLLNLNIDLVGLSCLGFIDSGYATRWYIAVLVLPFSIVGSFLFHFFCLVLIKYMDRRWLKGLIPRLRTRKIVAVTSDPSEAPVEKEPTHEVERDRKDQDWQAGLSSRVLTERVQDNNFVGVAPLGPPTAEELAISEMQEKKEKLRQQMEARRKRKELIAQSKVVKGLKSFFRFESNLKIGLRELSLNISLSFVVLYTFFVATSVEPLDCTTVIMADGSKRTFMDSYPDVVCTMDDDTYRAVFPIGIVAFIVYALLFPVTLGVFLFRNRKVLYNPDFLRKCGLVYNKYSPRRYYWPLWELMRKFLLIMFATMVSETPVASAILSLLLLLLGICVHLLTKPFRFATVNILSFLFQFILFTVLFCGLLFQSGLLSNGATVNIGFLINFMFAFACLAFTALVAFSRNAVGRIKQFFLCCRRPAQQEGDQKGENPSVAKDDIEEADSGEEADNDNDGDGHGDQAGEDGDDNERMSICVDGQDPAESVVAPGNDPTQALPNVILPELPSVASLQQASKLAPLPDTVTKSAATLNEPVVGGGIGLGNKRTEGEGWMNAKLVGRGAVSRSVLQGRHTSAVSVVSVAPTTIISGSEEGVLKVWDRNSNAPLVTLEGHEKPISCLFVDGDTLLSCSSERTVRVWSLETGECLHILEGKSTILTSTSIENTQLLAGYVDGMLRLWDIEQGECVWQTKAHNRKIRVSAMTTDQVISGCEGGIISVRSREDGKVIFVLKDHIKSICAIDVAAACLVSADEGGKLCSWNLVVGEKMNSVSVKGIAAVAIAGTRIVTAARSKIQIWDLSRNECVRSIEDCPSDVVSLRAEDATVYAGCEDGCTYIWEFTGTFQASKT